ncbi:MAG TPA: patatin-like phospholipase family protein, partial [Allosphingosinicella sp.]|nr:patatin-like phospholipase family protein [Allosphingosinicella sp.]
MSGAAGEDAITAVSTFDVLKAEHALIWPGEKAPNTLGDYCRSAYDSGQAALCLSGGGIRSAAFALGVLQALSRKGLLTRFHYQSTVSGGGYIGSWLQRWIYERKGDADAVMRALAGDEPDEIKRLRENSNFITPRTGLGSNDTWTAIVTSVRNIAINWMLFGPLLMLVALVPNIFVSSVLAMPVRVADTPQFIWVMEAIVAFAAATAAWSTCKGLPSYSERVLKSGSGDGWFTRRILLPMVIWSVAGTLLLSTEVSGSLGWSSLPGAV